MSNYRLNHSRYIDNGAKDIAENIISQEQRRPTPKQIKFYRQLWAKCQEHQVDPALGFAVRTRFDYARAIDKLLLALQGAGIDVGGNGKDATYVLKAREDYRRRRTVQESIQIEDGQPKRKPPKIENIFIKD